LFSLFSVYSLRPHSYPPSFPTRRSSDLVPFKLTEIGPFSVLIRMLPLLPSMLIGPFCAVTSASPETLCKLIGPLFACAVSLPSRSEEHTSELQSLAYLVCRLLLEKKKKN